MKNFKKVMWVVLALAIIAGSYFAGTKANGIFTKPEIVPEVIVADTIKVEDFPAEPVVETEKKAE